MFNEKEVILSKKTKQNLVKKGLVVMSVLTVVGAVGVYSNKEAISQKAFKGYNNAVKFVNTHKKDIIDIAFLGIGITLYGSALYFRASAKNKYYINEFKKMADEKETKTVGLRSLFIDIDEGRRKLSEAKPFIEETYKEIGVLEKELNEFPLIYHEWYAKYKKFNV